MQLLEAATQASIQAASSPGGAQEESKRKCALLVRVKRPSGEGPWYAFGMLGGTEPGDELTGHAFCAHQDEGGSRVWHGFYPRGAIAGWDNVPEADRIAGVSDFFKYVAGVLHHGDADHEYDDERLYEIERPSYDVATAFAKDWESSKVKYSLARNNCTTFVVKDARAASVSVPSGGMPFDNPASFGKGLAAGG